MQQRRTHKDTGLQGFLPAGGYGDCAVFTAAHRYGLALFDKSTWPQWSN